MFSGTLSEAKFYLNLVLVGEESLFSMEDNWIDNSGIVGCQKQYKNKSFSLMGIWELGKYNQAACNSSRNWNC